MDSGTMKLQVPEVIMMITEEILLNFMRETAYKPMTYQELERHFAIKDAHEFREFLKR